MADYWMKLYIEILDDPKMATLPDRLWRRVIELFLVAKKSHKDGHLPDTRQIAWLLRMNADDLEHDMSQIVTTGIVVREVNGWFIPNFVKRQAAVPDVERKAQERNRKKSQQYYGDVTDASRNVTQSTENRLTEAEQDASLCFELELYREVTGLLPDYTHEEEVKRNIQTIQQRRHIPREEVKTIMAAKFAEWCAMRTGDGKPYNPSNPKWLEWCINGYSPAPAPQNNKVHAGSRVPIRGV